MDIFFLGAGRPTRGWKPSALKLVTSNECVLDWQIHAFGTDSQIHFLGGYHVEDIISKYPSLQYTVIPDWDKNGPLHTLLRAPFSDKDVTIAYSDTIFRKSILTEFFDTKADIVIGVDPQWKDRYETRSEEDILSAETLEVSNDKTGKGETVEFAGLVRFSPQAIEVIKGLDESEVGTSILDLISYLESQKLRVEYFDVSGHWTELNAPEDVARFILGTKADTLSRLGPLVQKSHIGQQVSFTLKQWEADPQAILDEILNHFSDAKLIVRSSSKAEDSWFSSNAGGFTSLLNINGSDVDDISQAINSVFESYGDQQSSKDQVLIQEFLQEVRLSGVVFTCGLETGSPYYRFNFDDQTQSTESVTSGMQSDLRTVITSRFYPDTLAHVEPSLVPVLDAVRELESLLSYDKLDVEFAIDKGGVVHIFQVRPITVDHSQYEIDPSHVRVSLDKNAEYFLNQQKAVPFVFGDKALFGNMPDWNPAEIIGTNPKPLSFSLYRQLITNEVWALQRAEFGYRDVRPNPLISSFSGHPYVDVRASINSFIPAEISDSLASKLAQSYIDILDSNPQFHDKIEFDVLFTVWTPTFREESIHRLGEQGFSEGEIDQLGQALKNLTCNSFKRLEKDISSVDTLISRRTQIENADLAPIDKFFALIDDCRHYGTLAFSHAARSGFVAASFLKSFLASGILTHDRHSQFLRSFKTVAGEFEMDKHACREGQLDISELAKKYGHLRPGTYELSSEAYWEDHQQYLLSGVTNSKDEISVFTLTDQEKIKVSSVLSTMGSDLVPEDLFKYFEKAIKAREYVKFEFTRNLSMALDQCLEIAKDLSVSRDDFSYLQYHDLEQFKLNVIGESELKNRIKENKRSHLISQLVELPSLIQCKSDLFSFERHSSQPNFVTRDKAQASVAVLEKLNNPDLEGAIVLIPQADPGYDWLFGHNIRALITKYGGANSHMSIRAAEIGLPAAIGVGEKLYDQISQMDYVEIDCANQLIRKI